MSNNDQGMHDKQKSKAEDYLENIISLLPGHIYWKDLNCRFLGCNILQARAVGLKSHEDIVGKTAYDVIVKNQPEEQRIEQAKKIDSIDHEVMRTGKTALLEEPLKLEDGSEKIFLSKKVPLLNSKGDIIGMLGMSIDITSEKEADALRLKKEQAEKKLETMELIAASMAHELRTPLSAISAGIFGIKSCLPQLIEGYKLAKESNLDVPYINPIDYKALNDVLNAVELETKYAFSFIDMLLIKANIESISEAKISVCSISACVSEALLRYPFKHGEDKLIHWKKKDFLFFGNELLVIHVLFNLIKNSLYYVRSAGKGDIYIWCEEDNKYNSLHFKDTGEGIKKSMLPFIFDQFYTGTAHGAGVGLAFCKMVMKNLGGDIVCESKHGEFAEFILYFPRKSVLNK